jgi:hypothetical protein
MGGFNKSVQDICYIYGDHITAVTKDDVPYADNNMNIGSIFITEYLDFIDKGQELIINGFRYRIKILENINSNNKLLKIYLENIL